MCRECVRRCFAISESFRSRAPIYTSLASAWAAKIASLIKHQQSSTSIRSCSAIWRSCAFVNSFANFSTAFVRSLFLWGASSNFIRPREAWAQCWSLGHIANGLYLKCQITRSSAAAMPEGSHCNDGLAPFVAGKWLVRSRIFSSTHAQSVHWFHIKSNKNSCLTCKYPLLQLLSLWRPHLLG